MSYRKKPWVIILSIVQIGILYHLLAFSKVIVTKTEESNLPVTYEMNILQDFNNLLKVKETTSVCSMVAPMTDDPAYRFFFMVTRLLDHLCKQHSVQWFLWGDVSLRLHQFGARIVKSDNDEIHEKDRATFEIFISSEDVGGIENLLQDMLSESTKQPFLECTAKRVRVAPVACYAKPFAGKTMTLHIHAPAHVDMKSNQLTLADDNLLVKYAYKLDRIFPLRFASYYGLRVPVPKEPIYAFSHMVPFRGYRKPDLLEYKYVQGCQLVFHDVPLDIREQDVVICGESLNNIASANMFERCYGTKPEEMVVQLKQLVQSQTGEAIVRLEDFRDVVVLERGDGSYHLNHPNGKTHINGTPSWSQHRQDRFVDDYFHNKTGGFFIEVGAYDGETLSNSLYIEKVRGWDGLLIEAIPKIYGILQSKQRNCYSINACISNEDDGLVFTMADVYSGSNKQMPKRQMDRIQNRKRLTQMKMQSTDSNNTVEEVYVHCKSLMSILNKLNVQKIDFFSLDVEGTELFLLNSLDWDKIDVELFVIETDHHRNEIIEFMVSKGYNHTARLKRDDAFNKKRA